MIELLNTWLPREASQCILAHGVIYRVVISMLEMTEAYQRYVIH